MFKNLDDEWIEIFEGACFSTKNNDGTIVNAECIKKNTIPDTWNEELWSFIEVGKQLEKNGFPFNIGWAEHPAYLYDIKELYDEEVSRYMESLRGKK